MRWQIIELTMLHHSSALMQTAAGVVVCMVAQASLEAAERMRKCTVALCTANSSTQSDSDPLVVAEHTQRCEHTFRKVLVYVLANALKLRLWKC